MSEANKRTLLTLNKVVWNTGDVSRIGDFIHDDFIADYRPQGSLGIGHTSWLVAQLPGTGVMSKASLHVLSSVHGWIRWAQGLGSPCSRCLQPSTGNWAFPNRVTSGAEIPSYSTPSTRMPKRSRISQSGWSRYCP